jgi:antitoxin FitA
LTKSATFDIIDISQEEALMSNVLIRDFPPALKAEISKAANSNGRSISEEVKFRLRRDSQASAKNETKSGAVMYDQMREVMQGIFATDEEVDEFERVIEESRKNDFGRPPADFE